MSSTKPLVLGPPKVEQHAVLAVFHTAGYGRHAQFKDVVILRSAWGTAVAVQTKLENVRMGEGFGSYLGMQINHFCVRSVDDPRVKAAISGDRLYLLGLSTREQVSKMGSKALAFEREYVRKRVGELAREAVADESLDTLGQVINRVREDANREGLSKATVDAERAVKDRVMLGRVSTGYGYRDRGQAYFIRKKDGPLHKANVQGGRRLNQTTLAYRGNFYRLVKNEDGTLSPTKG